MLSLFKAQPKNSKAAQPAKKVKRETAKRPKGLGLVKKISEKAFSPNYNYGF